MNENVEHGPKKHGAESRSGADALPTGDSHAHAKLLEELVWALSALSDESVAEVHAIAASRLEGVRCGQPTMMLDEGGRFQ